jgi:hypothetical protein
MTDRVAIDTLDTGHDALAELLLGYHPDVTQDRAGKLGEEALDEIEPGAVNGREGEREAPLVEWRASFWSPSIYERNDCRELA